MCWFSLGLTLVLENTYVENECWYSTKNITITTHTYHKLTPKTDVISLRRNVYRWLGRLFLAFSILDIHEQTTPRTIILSRLKIACKFFLPFFLFLLRVKRVWL